MVKAGAMALKAMVPGMPKSVRDRKLLEEDLRRIGCRVVKSDVLAPPGRLGRHPVANVRTFGQTQHPRGKTAVTVGLR